MSLCTKPPSLIQEEDGREHSEEVWALQSKETSGLALTTGGEAKARVGVLKVRVEGEGQESIPVGNCILDDSKKI